MRLLPLTLTLSVLAAGASTVQPSASADPAARNVDRTLSCAVGDRAGVRSVTVRGVIGLRDLEDRSKWKHLATVDVRDEYVGFGGVGAGNPVADLAPGVPARRERLWIDAGRTCREAATIPLTKTGLAQVPLSRLGDSYRCRPGRRVFVRVRGVFRAPTSLRLKRYAGRVTQLAAAGTVQHGFVALRSAAGKPLAYAEVFESGKARLFAAPTCRED